MNKQIFAILLTFLTLNFFSLHSDAKSRLYLEKIYQNSWCSAVGGTQEVVLSDKARVDCVTPTHAVEFDFADKWGESIGQSLFYGATLGRKPGIVLIMEDAKKDKKYLDRVNLVARQNNITVWTMKPAELLLR